MSLDPPALDVGHPSNIFLSDQTDRRAASTAPTPRCWLSGTLQHSGVFGFCCFAASDMEKLETILVSEWAEITARYAQVRPFRGQTQEK